MNRKFRYKRSVSIIGSSVIFLTLYILLFTLQRQIFLNKTWNWLSFIMTGTLVLFTVIFWALVSLSPFIQLWFSIIKIDTCGISLLHNFLKNNIVMHWQDISWIEYKDSRIPINRKMILHAHQEEVIIIEEYRQGFYEICQTVITECKKHNSQVIIDEYAGQ